MKKKIIWDPLEAALCRECGRFIVDGHNNPVRVTNRDCGGNPVTCGKCLGTYTPPDDTELMKQLQELALARNLQ